MNQDSSLSNQQTSNKGVDIPIICSEKVLHLEIIPVPKKQGCRGPNPDPDPDPNPNPRPSSPSSDGEIKLPSLQPPVKRTLQRTRPFEEEFKRQTNNKRKKIGDKVYQGPIDQVTKQPKGYGKFYKKDGSIYIGIFINGQPKTGVWITTNGSYIYGPVKNNFFSCQSGGQYSSPSGDFQYTGGLKNNLFEGKGSEKTTDGNYSFEGQYKNGKKISGTMKFKDQDGIMWQYTGKFDQNQKFTGKGKLRSELAEFDGQFKDGKKQGYGEFKRFYYQENQQGRKEKLLLMRYMGSYRDGKKHGVGKILDSQDGLIFEGQFELNQPNGKGRFLNQNGEIKEGHFDRGINIELLE